MMLVRHFILWTFIIFSSSAHAVLIRGNEGAHGGDDIGITFKDAASKALVDIQKNYPDLQKLFSSSAALDALDKAQVLGVDNDLTLEVDGEIQQVVAANFPQSSLILVNTSRWDNLFNQKSRMALALHEVLSLIGIESTGHYPVSAKYYGKDPNSYIVKSCNFSTKNPSGSSILSREMDLEVIAVGEFTNIKITAKTDSAKAQLQMFARELQIFPADGIDSVIYTQRVKDAKECEITSSKIRCNDVRQSPPLAFVRTNGSISHMTGLNFIKSLEVNSSEQGVAIHLDVTRADFQLPDLHASLTLNFQSLTCN